MNTLACANETRRIAVRTDSRRAGFDYLEVGDDHLRLRVHFLGALPHTPLAPENFRIDGGRRIRDIQVIGVYPQTFADPELDDYVEIVVDKFGDYSTYTLRAVAPVINEDEEKTTWIAHPEFDPRYNQLDFTFTADCPTDLDCPAEPGCPPPDRQQVAISYLAKDYASFRQLIFDRLSVVMPEWRNRYTPDIGVTLVELLAYAGDYLSYYQDAVATEAYLDTARQRVSVRRHARLVDYALHEGCNARALVVVSVTDKLTVEPGKVRFITAPAPHLQTELTADSLAKLATGPYVVFEPVAATKLHAKHDEIEIYTWGDSECCLPRGATAATLVDEVIGKSQNGNRRLKLQAGDFVIFEEVMGPESGLEADRDPAHRWPVRLIKVTCDTDPLTGTPVLNIEWSKEDAFPFPLCLSSVGMPPECGLLKNVSVARGNVVLVDHGESVEDVLVPVEIVESPPQCDGENILGEVTRTAARYRPRLSRPHLVFREALPHRAPATRIFEQDPHKATPVVTAFEKWTPLADLIDSRSTDKNFTVEMDNERIAWLRFGDGTHGALPPAGKVPHAMYRVGGGEAGNVGSEAIAHALWDTQIQGLITSIRNPLPARGGIEPQTIEEAKLFAPNAFRTRLARAITADDYADLAEREFPRDIQRAAADLRWNGSWNEALVAIDAFGASQSDERLPRRIKRRLSIYRRMGHDLRVGNAVRVPLWIELQICVKAVHLKAHVEEDLRERFQAFFHPDNLTFGTALHLSKVVSEAQSVPGVESVAVMTFERMFDGPKGEIEAGYIGFGPFEIALCDSDPSFPGNGQIDFKMGGGR